MAKAVAARALGAAALLLLLAAQPASAVFEDVQLTSVWTDPADHAGTLDLRALSVGEPGDGNLLFKFEVGDITVPPNSRAIWFFTAAGKSYGPGINVGGAPTTFVSGTDPTAYADATPSSCVVDGNAAYCLIPYAKFAGAPGVAITNNYGISYFQAAQDYAPGAGGFVPNFALEPVGTDYTMTGCTKKGGCGAAAPAIVFGNLSSSRLVQSFTVPTNGTYVYNFTSSEPAQLLSFAANGTGTANVTLVDGAGAEKFNQSLAGGDNGTFDLGGAPAGNWTYRIVFTSFNGTLELDFTAPSAQGGGTQSSGSASGSASRSGTSGSSQGAGGGAGGNSTEDGEEEADAPAPALPALALVVALAVLLRRRRQA